MKKYYFILLTLLFAHSQFSTVNAQRKEGKWVNPVEFFKLKGHGDLSSSSLYHHMWETKERYIVGMKVTVCAFDMIGEGERTEFMPADVRSPYTPETSYLYMGQSGAIHTTCDTGYTLYKVAGTGINYTFNESSHTYSFNYTPTGTFSGVEEHPYSATGRTEMKLYYTERSGMLGYLCVAFNTPSEIKKDGEGNPIGYYYEETPYYIRFNVDEVLLDGNDTPLLEEERTALIEQMDKLAEWLEGKSDKLGLGEHTDETESAVIEVIGVIGSVLLSNGIASVTGSGTSLLAGMSGAGAGSGAAGAGSGLAGAAPTGAPTGSGPDLPNMDMNRPKEDDYESENPTESTEGPPPPPDNFEKYMRQNPDGTLTMNDPITGKPLTYYPSSDGKHWESELGTIYDRDGLNDNIRYRMENAETLRQDADTAARNVAKQHEQWEKDSKELSQTAKDYQAWKHGQEEALRKEEKINDLAAKYGVPPTEKAVKEAIKWQQTEAQLDADIANSEAEAYDKSIDTLDKIDKTSEVIVNVMGETVPGGRVVKNVYTFAKSTGVAASEAYNQGMGLGDAAKHIGMGAASGAVGVLQNQAGDITKNPLVEGTMVIGGESIRAGLDAIAHDKDISDSMLKAAGNKAAFFAMGKTVQFGLGQTGYTAPEMGNTPVGTMEKYLGKGGMNANWGDFTSTNAAHVTEGIASAAQEAPMTFGGFDNAGESTRDLAYGVSSQTKNDVSSFVKTVKNFSNAAEKYRKQQ